MKKFFTFFLTSLIYISCSNLAKNAQVEKKSITNNNLLNGVWTEKENENALFFIKNGNLYYTENQNNAIPIELRGDTLIIKNELAVYCKILKLSNDSLWFTDQFSNDTTKLIKRK